MNFIKKLMLPIFLCTTLFSFVGCGSKSSSHQTVPQNSKNVRTQQSQQPQQRQQYQNQPAQTNRVNNNNNISSNADAVGKMYDAKNKQLDMELQRKQSERDRQKRQDDFNEKLKRDRKEYERKEAEKSASWGDSYSKDGMHDRANSYYKDAEKHAKNAK